MRKDFRLHSYKNGGKLGNDGDTSFDWEVQSKPSWVSSISPDNGSISGSNSRSLNVTVSSSSAGSKNGTIKIKAEKGNWSDTKSVNISANFTKIPTEIIVDDIQGYGGEKITLECDLGKADHSGGINGKTIKWYVKKDGSWDYVGSETTYQSGLNTGVCKKELSESYTKELSTGNHDIKAVFEGDITYENSDGYGNLKILPTSSTNSNFPGPSSYKVGNGDAVYRYLKEANMHVGHTAIYYGSGINFYNEYHNGPIEENSLNYVIQANGPDKLLDIETWETFLSNNNYWGAYTQTRMTKEYRAEIILTGLAQIGCPYPSFPYTVYKNPASSHGSGDGMFRCDGLVEYSYECAFNEPNKGIFPDDNCTMSPEGQMNYINNENIAHDGYNTYGSDSNPDTQNPTVSFTEAPSSNTWVTQSNTISVSLTGNDNFTVSDNIYGKMRVYKTTGGYDSGWTDWTQDKSWTKNLPEGWFKLQAQNRDLVGRTSQTLEREFGIDYIGPPPPENIIVSPSNWTKNNSFEINWDNPPDTSGIAGAYYKYDNPPTFNEDGQYTTQKPINLQSTHQDIQKVYVWLKDNAGNIGNSVYVTLRYDATLPTGEITSPYKNYQTSASTITVGGNCNDSYSGVERVEVINTTNGNSGNDNSPSSTFSVSNISLDEGPNNIKAVIYDKADNTYETDQITVNRHENSPGQLQFSSSNYTVDENTGTGSVEITVTRTGGSDGIVGVHYATSDGTATSGSDYTNTSGDLSFPDGVTNRTITVNINNDSSVEENETFNVTLSNETGGAIIGSPSTSTVTIREGIQPLTITTPSPLPDGTEKVPYSQPLAATGGVPDYTWIITDGTLPPGLTLSTAGIISGTPTQSQSEPFTFTVQVSDSQTPADTDTKEFSLKINPHNEHEIILNAGWNLITLPVNPSSQIMASTIIDKIDTAGAFSNGVLRWINGIWDPYDGSYPPADFPIEVGKGYFVHCDTSNIIIPIEGTAVSSITIPILNGWTLIGVPCGSYQASTLIESLNDQDLTCDSVLRWINGVWDPYDGSYPPANFSIEISRGYFVYSGNSGNWQTLPYQISNQSDNSITISWVTETAVEASIEYGDTVALGDIAYDVRGQATSSTTHYINIPGLNPDTMYYFDLISGGERDDNSGNHYTFTTAVSINPSAPSTDKVSGTVYQSGGVISAPGSIVLVTLSGSGNSQTCSYLASDYSGYEGTYQILFNSFRTLDLTDWFNYNAGNTVTIQVLGGEYGNGQATTNLVLPVTTQDVTLQTN